VTHASRPPIPRGLSDLASERDDHDDSFVPSFALGRVPGIAKQSEIFHGMGHPNPALAHLMTYVWFAAMYRESPVGLQALVDPNDPASLHASA
jgi:hypothetical protein